jgi:hypothetical protein
VGLTEGVAGWRRMAVGSLRGGGGASMVEAAASGNGEIPQVAMGAAA